MDYLLDYLHDFPVLVTKCNLLWTFQTPPSGLDVIQQQQNIITQILNFTLAKSTEWVNVLKTFLVRKTSCFKQHFTNYVYQYT